MNEILLSIVIPHFNSPDMLAKLLASVPNKPEIQIIVVDDNSTKHLMELNHLIETEKRVEFYRNETGKNSAGTCRNTGLDHAKGKWLLFADADDYFVDGWYRKVRPFFETDFQMVFFRPTSIELDTGREGTRHLMYSDRVDAYLLEASHENELCIRYAFPVPWSKLIRRSFIEEHGIRFEPLRVSNDEWFSLMCGHHVKRFVCSAETIYCVTTHNDSLTTTPSKTNYDIRQKVYIRKYGFLFSHLTSDEIHALEIDFMPLYILFDSLMKGCGPRKVFEYRKMMWQFHVPLVNWEYVRFRELVHRLFSSVKRRIK